jgi:hypothetical protein
MTFAVVGNNYLHLMQGIEVLQNFDHLFKEAKAQGKGNKYTTPSLSQYLKIHSNYRKMRQDQG